MPRRASPPGRGRHHPSKRRPPLRRPRRGARAVAGPDPHLRHPHQALPPGAVACWRPGFSGPLKPTSPPRGRWTRAWCSTCCSIRRRCGLSGPRLLRSQASSSRKSYLLGVWMVLFTVFAARKFQQPIKDDIGDKSVFMFNVLAEEEKNALIQKPERQTGQKFE